MSGVISHFFVSGSEEDSIHSSHYDSELYEICVREENKCSKRKYDCDQIVEPPKKYQCPENTEHYWDTSFDTELVDLCQDQELLHYQWDRTFDEYLGGLCDTIKKVCVQMGHCISAGASTSRGQDEVSDKNNSSEVAMIHCATCNILVKRRYFSNHVNSNVHKNNLFRSKHSLENVKGIATAFKDQILTFRISTNNSDDKFTITVDFVFENIQSSEAGKVLTCSSIK